MRTTTVRFGADLWSLLEHEAERAGVSVSQYLREAALARAAAAAAARGDAPFGLLAGAVHEVTGGRPDHAARRHAHRALAALAQALAQDHLGETHAVVAESRQARRRARELQAAADQLD